MRLKVRILQGGNYTRTSWCNAPAFDEWQNISSQAHSCDNGNMNRISGCHSQRWLSNEKSISKTPVTVVPSKTHNLSKGKTEMIIILVNCCASKKPPRTIVMEGWFKEHWFSRTMNHPTSQVAKTRATKQGFEMLHHPVHSLDVAHSNLHMTTS